MKALIALSGGVDSSVAAFLTKNAGYDCIGCNMKLFDGYVEDEVKEKTCCSADDAEDARSVAYRIGIPFYVFSFRDEFEKSVINRFCSAYSSGLTPNPCIDCNKYLKFGALYERAKTLGCDKIVTGHYARIEYENGRYLLKKGLDPAKDQSYVLYSMDQDILEHTLFPLGGYEKPEVRRIAEENGFINARKRDSQDICFVPDGKYAEAVKRYTEKEFPAGEFVDDSGKVLGRHKGIIYYTIGQHKRLGIPTDRPLYVSRIDPESNRITLSPEEVLFGKTVRIKDVNLISVDKIEGKMRGSAKIRYRQKEAPATLEQTGSDEYTLTFDDPVRAATPGQAAVFYDGDTVVGGGTIV